jgi:hypothetical protein
MKRELEKIFSLPTGDEKKEWILAGQAGFADGLLSFLL